MTKNWTKITAEKKIKLFLDQKLIIYLSLGLHKERPSYRRGLQLSKEAIQHFKTWTFIIFSYFCGSFLPSWIRIRILWPDWIRIQSRSGYGSGSATLERILSFHLNNPVRPGPADWAVLTQAYQLPATVSADTNVSTIQQDHLNRRTPFKGTVRTD